MIPILDGKKKQTLEKASDTLRIIRGKTVVLRNILNDTKSKNAYKSI